MINTQQHIQLINKNKSSLLGYLLLLTCFFIFIEISLLIQASHIYFGIYKLIFSNLKIPRNVIPGIIYFIFVQLLLHFIYTLVIWVVAISVGATLNFSWKITTKFAFSLWIIGLISILIANQIYFPNSKFAILTSVLLPEILAKFLLAITYLIIIISFLIGTYGFIRKMPKLAMFLLGSFFIGIIFSFSYHSEKPQDASTKEKPNIIFIGMDSLRPDYLGFFGYEKITPNLDAFLNEATVFSDALTPLARTFPSWTSILSGQYPKISGVRFNLPASLQFNLQDTLPNILRKHGYETIFATDEARFSNIDERFGFEKIFSPPMGFNDFILGDLNDFPMANLLVNTTLGSYLFPYSYCNRPAVVTYDPNNFIQFLKNSLAKSRTKPLFFAVHLCLPHYPYFWGGIIANDNTIRNYQLSIKRVDEQFRDLLIMLNENNLLKNSIIVLLSDHGEALNLPGDRVTDPNLFLHNKNSIPHFFPQSDDEEKSIAQSVNRSFGHGTDVLGLTQYHVLLAFKIFRSEKNIPKILSERVSLVDIKPTILDFLQFKDQCCISGVSLKSVILGQNLRAHKQDHFFIESDFSPQAVRSVHPEIGKLLFQSIDLFQIDPTTNRVTVKDAMVKVIISSKQYADIYQDWILALYPQSNLTMQPILVNLKTGYWTNDLSSTFAKQSPVKQMFAAMKNFYHEEISSLAMSHSF